MINIFVQFENNNNIVPLTIEKNENITIQLAIIRRNIEYPTPLLDTWVIGEQSIEDGDTVYCRVDTYSQISIELYRRVKEHGIKEGNFCRLGPWVIDVTPGTYVDQRVYNGNGRKEPWCPWEGM